MGMVCWVTARHLCKIGSYDYSDLFWVIFLPPQTSVLLTADQGQANSVPSNFFFHKDIIDLCFLPWIEKRTKKQEQGSGTVKDMKQKRLAPETGMEVFSWAQQIPFPTEKGSMVSVCGMGSDSENEKRQEYDVGTCWLCVGTHAASVVTKHCAVRLPPESTAGAAQKLNKGLSGPGKEEPMSSGGSDIEVTAFLPHCSHPKAWIHSVFLKDSLCVCHFSDPEVGAAVLFIKAEETKQQINKLNSEVWRGEGDQNSTYSRSGVTG